MKNEAKKTVWIAKNRVAAAPGKAFWVVLKDFTSEEAGREWIREYSKAYRLSPASFELERIEAERFTKVKIERGNWVIKARTESPTGRPVWKKIRTFTTARNAENWIAEH